MACLNMVEHFLLVLVCLILSGYDEQTSRDATTPLYDMISSVPVPQFFSKQDWNSSDLVDDSADDAYSEEASDGMDEFAETDDNRNDDAGGLQKGKEIAETKQS